MLLLLFTSQFLHAQFTISTEGGTFFTGGNGVTGSSSVTFAIRNNNANPVILTGVDAYWQTTNNNTNVVLWYSSTSLGGATGGISTPNWQTIASAGPIAVPSNGYYPTLTGLSFSIPGNTTYRFAIQSSNGIRYSGNAPIPSPASFSSASVDLGVYDANFGGGSIGYGGAFPTPTNVPRAFTGRVHLMSSSPCAGLPTAGTSTATPTTACQNETTNLSLTGSTLATGLTYQWFHSTDNSNFTPIGGATTINYTATLNTSGTNYYRCAVTCTSSLQTATSSSVLINVTGALSGTYTINNTLPTGGTNFNNFQDAFAALACGSTGPVTRNVSAGQSFNSTGTLLASFSGSLSNPIVFQKSGVGANPSISFTGSSATTDAGLRFNGSDFITWDGINLVQGGTTSADWIEYGLHITKFTGTNGANNNTFRNFNVNLGTNTGTTVRGIFMDNNIASSASSGASSNNLFQNINTSNTTSAGIWLAGSTTDGFQDVNNIIDGCTMTWNSAAAAMYGIYLTGQQNFEIKNNTVGNSSVSSTSATNAIYITGNVATTGGAIFNNIAENITNTAAGVLYGIQVFNGGVFNIYGNTIRGLSSTTTVRGIFLNGVAGTTSDVHRNRIYGINSSSATTTYAAGIQSGPGVNKIYNNMISGITANSSTATPGVRGIDVTGGVTHEIYNNTVIVGGTSASSAALAWSVTFSIDVRNNIFINNSSSATFAAALYRSTAGNPNFTVGSGNNLYYTGVPSATRPIYRNATNSVNDLSAYLGLGAETISFTEDVQFTVSNGQITLNTTIPTYAESNGQNLAMITVDYFNTARGAYPLAGQQPNGGTATDIGAQEGNFLKNVPAQAPDCATLTLPANNATDICPSNVLALTWQAPTTGPTVTDGYDVFFGTINPPPFLTNVTSTNYLATGLISGQTYYWSIEPKNDVGNADGCSVFSFSTANHSITSTTPGSVCGQGAVTLSATPSSGTVNWYANPTGGSSLATGNTFTTPTINSTTTYYASTSLGGGSSNVGLPNLTVTPTAGSGTTNFGIVFDALSPFLLQQVTIYPVSNTSSPGTVTVDVINGSSTVLHTATFNVVGSPGGVTPVVLNLNFAIDAGTNLKLRASAFTGISGNNFLPSAGAPIGGNYGYPFVVPGVVSLNHSTLSAAPTNTPRLDLYYYFFNWQISTGCESSRIPVVATVTTADVVSITPATPVSCPGESVNLTASSSNPNYTYTWTPGNSTTSSITVNPITTTTYTVSGTDGLCTDTEQVTVTVNGAVLGTITGINQICEGASTTLTVSGSVGNIQWQSFNGTSWVDIAGQTGTTLTISPIITTQYRTSISFVGCPVLQSSPVTVTVSNIGTLTTTPGSVCGQGVVQLSATTTSGTVNWYANPTGGVPLGTGNTFTTPSINSTTTYYANSISGGSIFNGGRLAPNTTSSANLSNYVQHFTITEDITLNSVQLFSTTGTAVTVSLYNSTGTVLLQSTGSVAVVAATSPNINLGWSIPAGTYRLGAVAMTGTFVRDNPASPGFTYPVALGSVGQINGFSASLTGALTTSANVYYYVYNWNITTGCQSARIPVTASVNIADQVSIMPSTLTSCPGDQVSLTASSANLGYSYSWMPGSLSGASVNVNPITTTTYTVTATDGSCTDTEQVTITVNGAVLGTISGANEICSGSAITLTLTGSVGNIQWQSFNGSSWENILGQSTSTINVSPSLTTQYRAAINFAGCPIIFTAPFTVTVNNPQVLSVQSESSCGPGQVSVTATPSAGSTIEWYSAPTGGSPLFTGNSYSTNIAANTTFYAQANSSSVIQTGGKLTPTAALSTTGTNWGLVFDVVNPTTLVSVDVYPNNATGGSMVIELRNSTGALLQTLGIFTYPSGNGTVPHTLNLNLPLSPGTGYRLVSGAGMTGNLVRETSGNSFPYTSTDNNVTVTSGFITNPGSQTYYWFYNWKLSSSCQSARTAVNTSINNCPVTQLRPADCGATNVTMNKILGAVDVSAAAYRFRITGSNNGGTGWAAGSFTYVAPAPSRTFRFQFIPGAVWGATYVVEVATGDGNGNWGSYGPACTVTLVNETTTQVTASTCGTSVSGSQFVSADWAPGAVAYRFRIQGANNGGPGWASNTFEHVTTAPVRKFTFGANVPGAVFGATYSIDVAVQSADGFWMSYGTPCNVTLVAPTTQIQTSQCNITDVLPTTSVNANQVAGASGYRFKFVGANSTNWVNNEFILDRPNRTFWFNLVTGSLQGEEYQVTVAVMDANGNYGAYGSMCTVTRFGVPEMPINENDMFVNSKTLDGITFDATASHNPFTTDFGIQVLNANDSETINVVIYDMSGKLIERQAVNPMDIENAKFGANLASGMYMIEVKQGTNQAVIRQVKN